jgi:hypothetical protein
MLPLRIDGDLNVRVGGACVRLTPSEGLEAAEQLIRKSTRRMMVEEALDLDEPLDSTSGRKGSN